MIALVENYEKKKKPHLFSHCNYFDHPALQPLNNCRFIFLGLPNDTLNIHGLVAYRQKGFENTLLTVYHTPQDIEIYSCKMIFFL